MWLARQLWHPGWGGHFFPSSRRLLLTSLRLFSPSASSRDAPPPPAEPGHFMVDYLVSSCGLSSAEALRVSKPLAHLRSPEKPDAVLRLLRQEGLGDAHIRRAVLRYPRVLVADAKKTLEPKIRAIQGGGFTSSELAQLISLSPNILLFRDVLHRVGFWRELLGNNRNLLTAMKRDPRVLCYSLDDKVAPRLSLLRSLGVPNDNKMGTLLLRKPLFMSATPAKIESLAEQVRSLGFSPGSPMFLAALYCVGNLSRSTLDAKSTLWRSFGWTQAELISAVRKYPNILTSSEKKIRATMDFLLNEAGCEPSYIAQHPTLVTLSMEKRLKPRFHVLQLLKLKALPSGRISLFTTMKMTDDRFIQKFIIPYSDEYPELLESYHAVVAKNAKTKI